jgi:galactose mutarotase-like enzyme
MHYIQSKRINVGIDSKGAELKTVFHKGHNLEYMWGGDPAIWAKTSPVLFPIVGTLKDNKYKYNGRDFTLGRHGFARDKAFSIIEQTDSSITFTIESSDATLAVYPFAFRFSVAYSIEEEKLNATYIVRNKGDKTMLFSVGGHPAFKLPLIEGTTYDDYKLIFEKEETAGRWPISKDGLIEKTPQPLLQSTNELPLSKQLFQKDAVVLKNLKSAYVKLASDKTEHGLTFHFNDFPYLGLWAAPNADFVCIEPWCGIADSVDSDQQLENKEGIISLPPGEKFKVRWEVDFF